MSRPAVSRSLLAAALLWAVSASGGTVNFKIGTVEDPGPEGPGVIRSFITVGDRRMAFRKPQHAEITSQPDNITVFLSENGVSGQFTITNSSFPSSLEFLANLETYQGSAEATLPKEAENVEFVAADPNLYTVNDWKSQMFEWKYSFFAHPTHRQVAYIDLDSDHQICLTILSDEASWSATYAVARRFMKSWYWLDDLKVAKSAPAR